MSSHHSKATYIFGLTSLLLAVAGVAWWLGKPSGQDRAVPENTAAQTSAPTPPSIDLADPAVEFTTFQHVVDTGGCEITRPIAIEWLDQHANHVVPPGQTEQAALYTMLDQGGHPSWDHGYRQHIFNSAINALHLAPSAEKLTRALHHLALHDSDLTMRLYALQHLGIQREHGRLTGPPADEVRASLIAFASDEHGPCAGKAISLLAIWDGPVAGAADTRAQAALIAADPARAVDVRVDAIHAAGNHGLATARVIASDPAAPVILRKAAIARIGEHGDTSDLDTLDRLGRENHRIAQATVPALANLRHRLANPDAPAPLPF